MEGAAPIWFCKREGCPLLLVAEEKKKIKGSGARRRAVRVCMGLWEELDYGGEKKKKGKAVCRKNRAEKLILCQL